MGPLATKDEEDLPVSVRWGIMSRDAYSGMDLEFGFNGLVPSQRKTQKINLNFNVVLPYKHLSSAFCPTKFTNMSQ